MKVLKDLKKKIMGETRWRNPFHNGRHRNEKCFCGSGKKLKRCHGQEATLDKEEMDSYSELFTKWESSPEGLKYYQEMREGK